MKMPILPVDAMVADCDEWEAGVVRAAFTTRGVPAGGKLRASKPHKRVNTFEEGCANYVWRMLCFDLCDFRPHVCMPVTADFEVWAGLEASLGRPERGDRAGRNLLQDVKRDMTKVLDVLVDKVERKLPIEAKKGMLRWGLAFGMI